MKIITINSGEFKEKNEKKFILYYLSLCYKLLKIKIRF